MIQSEISRETRAILHDRVQGGVYIFRTHRHILVCQDCRGVSVLFSGVFSMSRCDRLVFWYVLNVAVCPSCLLLCPDIGVSRLVFCCVRNVAMCSPCSLVCPDVHEMSAFVFWCVQDLAVCPSCLLV